MPVNKADHERLMAMFLAAFLLWLPTAHLLADEEVVHALMMETVEVNAPFDMPAILIPDFCSCPRFPITDFGAKPESESLVTSSIADAIDAAHAAGGGVVLIPEGVWKTGKIHFKSNVNLHLVRGAVLEFSGDPNEYLPAVKTTWEGMECYNYSPLIYAYECQNIAISGSGTLVANLDVWKSWYARPKPHMDALKQLYHMAAKGAPVEERQMAIGENHLRPQFIQFNRCENVLLEGVTIQNSPFWVIHPFLSKQIVIRHVSVNARGHNNDGVDPEMSQNLLIEDCVFNQGDDAIAVKSGRNQDAWRLNTPAKNIVIRNCQVKRGHQLMAIGSELSGGVENILIENCQVDTSLTGVGHLLYIKTNKRRGGYAKNIYMRNIHAGNLRYGVLGIETNVLYQWKDLVPTYEERLTSISDIHLEDITVGEVEYVTLIEGDSSVPVHNISLGIITVRGVRGDTYRNKNVTEMHVSKKKEESMLKTK